MGKLSDSCRSTPPLNIGIFPRSKSNCRSRLPRSPTRSGVCDHTMCSCGAAGIRASKSLTNSKSLDVCDASVKNSTSSVESAEDERDQMTKVPLSRLRLRAPQVSPITFHLGARWPGLAPPRNLIKKKQNNSVRASVIRKPAMKKLHVSSIFSDVRELRTGISG